MMFVDSKSDENLSETNTSTIYTAEAQAQTEDSGSSDQLRSPTHSDDNLPGEDCDCSEDSSDTLTETSSGKRANDEKIAIPSSGFTYVQQLPENSNIRKDYGLKYVCCEPHSYTFPNGVEVTVPLGFLSDGCTVGYDKFGQKEWLIHDFLYFTEGRATLDAEEATLTRYDADSVFLSCSQFHRWLAVRIFGRLFWGGGSRPQPANRIQPDLVSFVLEDL